MGYNRKVSDAQHRKFERISVSKIENDTCIKPDPKSDGYIMDAPCKVKVYSEKIVRKIKR